MTTSRQANNDTPAPWETFLPGAGDFEAIVEPENLLAAFRLAARGKRCRPNVARAEWHREEVIDSLQEMLLNGTYLPGRYHTFVVHENKRRLISAAPFRDRIVHHALCRITAARFERAFVVESHANRIGHGTHRALRDCAAYSARMRYVLPVDLKQFFPSIDHSILREQLHQKVLCARTRTLIDRLIRSGESVLRGEYVMHWFPDDALSAAWRPRGLPIGNLTSQIWANVYLSPLDHFVKRELRCRAYIRYVDDMLLFSDSKSELWEWHSAICARLDRLRVTMHRTHPRPVTEGVPFLGFITFPGHRRIKNRKARHFHRKYRRLQLLAASGVIPWTAVTAAVKGWTAHAVSGDTWRLNEAILSSPNA